MLITNILITYVLVHLTIEFQHGFEGNGSDSLKEIISLYWLTIYRFYLAFTKSMKANGLCKYLYSMIRKICDNIFILATDAKYYIFLSF